MHSPARCRHCRRAGFARPGRHRVTALFERVRGVVLYTCRCEQCGHERSGETSVRRFALEFGAD